MLRRAPDQESLDYLVSKLNNGEQTNELVYKFISSSEYQEIAGRSAPEDGFGN
jgi:hypothetical protein